MLKKVRGNGEPYTHTPNLQKYHETRPTGLDWTGLVQVQTHSRQEILDPDFQLAGVWGGEGLGLVTTVAYNNNISDTGSRCLDRRLGVCVFVCGRACVSVHVPYLQKEGEGLGLVTHVFVLMRLLQLPPLLMRRERIHTK